MKNVLHLVETHSTNDVLKKAIAENAELPDGYTVFADFQTAGRGQQGNSWESGKGKNLLFSTLFRIEQVPIEKQFMLSELVSVAIANVLGKITDEIAIKWPNDIYWRDHKLAGILIEHSLVGKKLASSVAGIGLNVNQENFISSAPNPISLKQITGKEHNLEHLLQDILAEFEQLKPLLQQPELLKKAYMQHLYRQNGWYEWVENECSIAPIHIVQNDIPNAFTARIKDILDNGLMVLETQSGKEKTYHFKEIKYIIK